MSDQTRERILAKLRNAPQRASSAGYPPLPARAEQDMTPAALAAQFQALLEAQTGVFKRAQGKEGVLAALAQVFEEEKITKAMASSEALIAELDLPAWGAANGFFITTHQACADRKAFKDGVFTEVEAGITGADFGFAESGTLCLAAGPDRPRLTSLAPIIHIAVLPAKRLVPTYEHMLGTLFKPAPPSQLILITGPSMTADIQATPFKGMHGPRRLIVILQDA